MSSLTDLKKELKQQQEKLENLILNYKPREKLQEKGDTNKKIQELKKQIQELEKTTEELEEEYRKTKTNSERAKIYFRLQKLYNTPEREKERQKILKPLDTSRKLLNYYNTHDILDSKLADEINRRIPQYEEKENIEIEKKYDEKEKQNQQHKKDFTDTGFPRVWSNLSIEEDYKKIFKKRTNTLPWDFFKFKVFVNETNFFKTNFKELDFTWENKEGVKDIRESKFNLEDPFFNSVASVFVLCYKGGFSLRNINFEENPKVVESLSKFNFYFWLARWQRQPKLLEKHLDTQDKKFFMNNLKLKNLWQKKFDYTKRIPGLEEKDLNKKYKHWRNLRTHTSHYGGQIGYSYEIIDRVVPVDEKTQFMRFIRDFSKGLTPLGQKLLLKSAEAFTYCILGSQADTHFPIVGQGARSYQTQDVFHQLVKDTVVQNDDTIMISNMRTAISSTNVILNLVISPGLIILPSSLVILKEKIPGYNNVLTISTSDMKFGMNKDLNKEINLLDKKIEQNKTEQNKTEQNKTEQNKTEHDTKKTLNEETKAKKLIKRITPVKNRSVEIISSTLILGLIIRFMFL